MATFEEALREANEESLDDLAHYRPNRHGRIDLDCFGKGYRRVDPEDEPPIEVRTFPEDGCPPFCTDCRRDFIAGEIFHPERDGTRCIDCFKAHWRAIGQSWSAAIRERVPDEESHRQSQANVAKMVEAAFAPPDPNAMTMREAVASLGDPRGAIERYFADDDAPRPSPEEIRTATEGFFEEMHRPIPGMIDVASQVIADLDAEIAASAVGKCSRCGKPTANPQQIGAQCYGGPTPTTEPCRGFVRNLDGTFNRPSET